jgi:hypothetical protein
VKPVDDAFGHEVAATLGAADYKQATRTLNLEPPPSLGGQELARWVENALLSVPDAEPGDDDETASEGGRIESRP